MPNNVGGKKVVLFHPIVLWIGVEKPSRVLNLPTTFSNNLITVVNNIFEISMSLSHWKRAPNKMVSKVL